MWTELQGSAVRVDDYISQMRKNARRLNFADDILDLAIINGLRALIRVQVAQQGVNSLEDTIRTARIAKASLASTNASLTSVLAEMIKSTEKQSAKIDQLTS